MRRSYLVCYDICNEKRLQRVFKTCRNWGNHLQFSIFECDLNPGEKTQFESLLKDLINEKEDQILFVDLGSCEHRGDRVITALGTPYTKFDAPCFIV